VIVQKAATVSQQIPFSKIKVTQFVVVNVPKH